MENKNVTILSAIAQMEDDRSQRLSNMLVRIWSDYDTNLDDWKGYLSVCYPGVTSESVLCDLMAEENRKVLKCHLAKLDKEFTARNYNRSVVFFEEKHKGVNVEFHACSLRNTSLAEFFRNACCGGWTTIYLAKNGDLCMEVIDAKDQWSVYVFRFASVPDAVFESEGLSAHQFLLCSAPMGTHVASALGIENISFEADPSSPVAVPVGDTREAYDVELNSTSKGVYFCGYSSLWDVIDEVNVGGYTFYLLDVSGPMPAETKIVADKRGCIISESYPGYLKRFTEQSVRNLESFIQIRTGKVFL